LTVEGEREKGGWLRKRRGKKKKGMRRGK
jgi:hypothetical protein